MTVRSDAVKNAVHIESVIEHYTGQAFNNNRICCPFHSEKTASFFVNPKKQYFKCFGCGVGGDVFKFVQMYFGCDFKTAIDLICRDFNIDASVSISEAIKESESIRKRKTYRKWQNDTYSMLRDALWSGKSYLELNRPMIDVSEITDAYSLMINNMCKIEFYFDEFLRNDKEFYENYRKEAQDIAGRILSGCGKRQDSGACIRRTAV